MANGRDGGDLTQELIGDWARYEWAKPIGRSVGIHYKESGIAIWV